MVASDEDEKTMNDEMPLTTYWWAYCLDCGAPTHIDRCTRCGSVSLTSPAELDSPIRSAPPPAEGGEARDDSPRERGVRTCAA